MNEAHRAASKRATMRTTAAAAALIAGTTLVASLAAPRAARADLGAHDIEIALGAGLTDRSTAGIGEPFPSSFGRETGLSVDLGIRAYLGRQTTSDGGYVSHEDSCIHAGFGMRAIHHAGAVLGFGGFGMRTTVIDLEFDLRSGCLDLGDWLLAGYGGASLALASPGDAPGRGTGSLSHSALGGHVGADLSLHAGPWLIGPFLEVRYMGAFGGPVETVAMATIGLRMGFDIDLWSSDEAPPEDRHPIDPI